MMRPARQALPMSLGSLLIPACVHRSEPAPSLPHLTHYVWPFGLLIIRWLGASSCRESGLALRQLWTTEQRL
jgi:hypothetical protein